MATKLLSRGLVAICLLILGVNASGQVIGGEPQDDYDSISRELRSHGVFPSQFLGATSVWIGPRHRWPVVLGDDEANQIDDSVLARIKELNEVELIIVSNYGGLRPDQYVFLKDLPKLESLRIDSHQGTCGSMIQHITNVKTLKSVSLHIRSLSADNIKELLQNTSLEGVEVICELTPEHFKAFTEGKSNIERLTILGAANYNPSREDLDSLLEIKSLKYLYIDGRELSREDMLSMSNSLPNCVIRYQNIEK